MADEQKVERTVSLTITVRVASLSASQAQEIEDAIRDMLETVESADVQATRGAPRFLRGV